MSPTEPDDRFLRVVFVEGNGRGASQTSLLVIDGSTKPPLHWTERLPSVGGVLDAERQLAGRPLNIADGMIAATALEHGPAVVTRNVKDFDQLGVTVFNPWVAA